MPDDLIGQLIGSIRRVSFVPAQTQPAGAGSSTQAIGSTDASGAIEIEIEIETKIGRYVHLAADRGSHTLLLRAGAARSPDAAHGVRHWQDLTADVPSAFAGRPTITAVTPVDPTPARQGDPAARAWRFDLSTGAAFCCRWSAAGPVVDVPLA